MKNNDIAFLRFLAIIAIVLHHSFCAFGGWPPNHAIGGEIPVYAYAISGILKTFGLGSFTFMSGYVLYYQKGKNDTYMGFLIKKARRILVPCLFWAIIYWIFFSTFMYNDWPSPINGTHLWYLPMLFVSILIVSYDIYCGRYSFAFLVIAWLFFVALSRFIHVRTLSEVFHYLPTFALGYYFHKYRIAEYINKKYTNNVALVIGVICCILSVYINIKYIGGILQLSLFSTIAFFIVRTFRNNKTLGKFGKNISSASFSIYLMHQFIINILLAVMPFRNYDFYLSFIIIAAFALFSPLFINEIYINLKMTFKSR